MSRAVAGGICRLGAVLALAAIAWLCPAAQGWAKASPGVRPLAPSELEGFVDGVLAEGMKERHVAGATVAVVQNGRVVLIKGYGVARPGQPVDAARDLFRIGSISKTFTWIALMRAVEHGQLKLDDPVNAYLTPDLRIPDQGFARPIRIIDLMSHSPGFEVVERNHLTLYSARKIIPPSQELRLHRPDRVRAPGVLSSYSNYGAALAGYIVARLANSDYPSLVERDITGPLAMSSTTFREPYAARAGLPAPVGPELAGRLATGFDWKGDHFEPAPFEFISPSAPAGSASTTAPDMARYMLMQLQDGTLGGVRLYGAQTARAFRTPIMKTPAGVNGWAHGLMIRTLPGGYPGFGHGGSLDHFYSNLVLAPDLNLGVFISTNTSTGRPLAESLPKLIVEHFYAPPQPPIRRAGSPDLLRSAANYAGRYITTRRAYSGLEAFADILESHDRVSVTPDGYLLTVLDGQARSWAPSGPPGHFVDAEGPEELVFTLDAKGRAVRFPAARGTYWAERAGPLMGEGLLAAVAALVLAGSVGTWIGWVARLLRQARDRRRWARRSAVLNLVVASLWLLAFAAFWASGLLEGERPGATFPGPMLLAASWSALGACAAAALAAVAACGALVEARGDGAAGLAGRLAAAGLVTASAVLGLLLALRGGLAPWS